MQANLHFIHTGAGRGLPWAPVIMLELGSLPRTWWADVSSRDLPQLPSSVGSLTWQLGFSPGYAVKSCPATLRNPDARAQPQRF